MQTTASVTQVVAALNATAQSLLDLAKSLATSANPTTDVKEEPPQAPSTDVVKEAKPAEPTEQAKPLRETRALYSVEVTFEMLKKEAQRIAKEHPTEVKALIKKYGAKLSEIPKDKYNEFYAELDNIDEVPF